MTNKSKTEDMLILMLDDDTEVEIIEAKFDATHRIKKDAINPRPSNKEVCDFSQKIIDTEPNDKKTGEFLALLTSHIDCIRYNERIDQFLLDESNKVLESKEFVDDYKGRVAHLIKILKTEKGGEVIELVDAHLKEEYGNNVRIKRILNMLLRCIAPSMPDHLTDDDLKYAKLVGKPTSGRVYSLAILTKALPPDCYTSERHKARIISQIASKISDEDISVGSVVQIIRDYKDESLHIGKLKNGELSTNPEFTTSHYVSKNKKRSVDKLKK